jgi:hypothetical protein
MELKICLFKDQNILGEEEIQFKNLGINNLVESRKTKYNHLKKNYNKKMFKIKQM